MIGSILCVPGREKHFITKWFHIKHDMLNKGVDYRISFVFSKSKSGSRLHRYSYRNPEHVFLMEQTLRETCTPSSEHGPMMNFSCSKTSGMNYRWEKRVLANKHALNSPRFCRKRILSKVEPGLNDLSGFETTWILTPPAIKKHDRMYWIECSGSTVCNHDWVMWGRVCMGFGCLQLWSSNTNYNLKSLLWNRKLFCHSHLQLFKGFCVVHTASMSPSG